jgi:hypothetical protein
LSVRLLKIANTALKKYQKKSVTPKVLRAQTHAPREKTHAKSGENKE